jgi:hypothetical protein
MKAADTTNIMTKTLVTLRLVAQAKALLQARLSAVA